MRARKVDLTAKSLTAYAEDLGFVVYTINGDIDAVLAWGQRLTAVDWKSTGGTLTPAQQRLMARGFPVRFIAKPEQLDALKQELSR